MGGKVSRHGKRVNSFVFTGREETPTDPIPQTRETRPAVGDGRVRAELRTTLLKTTPVVKDEATQVF